MKQIIFYLDRNTTIAKNTSKNYQAEKRAMKNEYPPQCLASKNINKRCVCEARDQQVNKYFGINYQAKECNKVVVKYKTESAFFFEINRYLCTEIASKL